MTRSPRLLALLALVGLMVLNMGAVAAKGRPGDRPEPGHGKPVKARISWSSPRIMQPAVPGQSSTFTATFTSSANLDNVELRIPGQLGKMMQATPAHFDHLLANTPATVSFTVLIPATRKAGVSGVVLVVSGKRVLPAPLAVRVTVAHTEPGTPGTPTSTPAPSEPTSTPKPGDDDAPTSTPVPSTPTSTPVPSDG